MIPRPIDSHNSFDLLKLRDEIIGFALFCAVVIKTVAQVKIPIRKIFFTLNGIVDFELKVSKINLFRF